RPLNLRNDSSGRRGGTHGTGEQGPEGLHTGVLSGMSLAAAFIIALQLTAQQPPAVQAPAAVAGEGEPSFEAPQGGNTARLTFTQEQDRISASLVVPLGTVQLSGTESADGNLKMTGSVEFQGTSMPLGLGAHVTGEAMTGLVTLGSLGELAFTGKRPE